jgi:hypothetical protein
MVMMVMALMMVIVMMMVIIAMTVMVMMVMVVLETMMTMVVEVRRCWWQWWHGCGHGDISRGGVMVADCPTWSSATLVRWSWGLLPSPIIKWKVV